MRISRLLLATILVSTAISIKPANAAIITSYEIDNPGVQYNQFGNNDNNGSVTVYTQTFNGAVTSTVIGNEHYDSSKPATGVITNNYQWFDGTTLIGTYDKIYVLGADSFGGSIDPTSNGTRSNYSSVNANFGLTTSTLTLAANQKYFGFWWSAGDGNNVINFYDDTNTLVGKFTSSIITQAISKLPQATQNLYKGNPTTSPKQDGGEYFAFINFFATGNTNIRSLVFTNNGTTGFENDNHTVATTYNSIRGAVVPEPLTIVGAATALILGGLFKSRAKKF